jgi:hypothetical protein
MLPPAAAAAVAPEQAQVRQAAARQALQVLPARLAEALQAEAEAEAESPSGSEEAARAARDTAAHHPYRVP